MKDYSATITFTVGLTAKDDEQAEERGNELSEAFAIRFQTPTGKDRLQPKWVGDQESPTVDIEEV
jgi:hypothetical protein